MHRRHEAALLGVFAHDGEVGEVLGEFLVEGVVGRSRPRGFSAEAAEGADTAGSAEGRGEGWLGCC